MFFAKLHPWLVHFPVALLVSGALFELLGKLQNEEAISEAGWFNIRFGYWSILPAMGAGIIGVLSMEIKPAFKPFLVSHILYAFMTAAVFSGILILHQFRKYLAVNIFYQLFLLAGLFCVLATGYFGGELANRFGLASGKIP